MQMNPDPQKRHSKVHAQSEMHMYSRPSETHGTGNGHTKQRIEPQAAQTGGSASLGRGGEGVEGGWEDDLAI